MKTLHLLLATSVIIFGGCASTQNVVESMTIPKGASRVVLVRKGSMIGGAQGLKVYDPGKVYDGEKLCSETQRQRDDDGWFVGKISNGGRLTWYRAPGPMWLMLKIFGGPPRQLEEINTEAGKEYTIEFSMGTLKGPQTAEKAKITVRDLQ